MKCFDTSRERVREHVDVPAQMVRKTCLNIDNKTLLLEFLWLCGGPVAISLPKFLAALLDFRLYLLRLRLVFFSSDPILYL